MLSLAQQHFAQQFLAAMMHQFLQHPDVFKEGTVRIGLNRQGQLELSMKLPNQNTLAELGVIGLFTALRLSRADHQQLQSELLALVQRFQTKQINQRAKSLLFVGLTSKP